MLGGGACIFLQETKEQNDSIAVVNILIFGHAIPCCGLECIHCDGEKPLAVWVRNNSSSFDGGWVGGSFLDGVDYLTHHGLCVDNHVLGAVQGVV